MAANLVALLILFLSPDTLAQTCSFPSGAPEGFIMIDGEVYEYTTVAQSKERAKMVVEGKAAVEKVKILTEQLALQDGLLQDYEVMIDTMMDERDISYQIIQDHLIDADQNQPPFFERPVVNFVLGTVFTSVLFATWKLADSGLNVGANR